MTIQQHFCQEELKDWSLFGAAESCMDKKQVASHCVKHQHQPSFDQKNCCDDRATYANADLEATQGTPTTADAMPVCTMPPSIPFQLLLNARPLAHYPKVLRYYHYKAPPPTYKSHIYFQVFRC